MIPILIDVPDQLTTPRLTLRVPRAGDGPMIYPAVRESLTELKHWMPWAKDAYSVDDAEEWCRRAAASYLERSAFHYVILRRGDGIYLGNISAFKLDWSVRCAEIGYWLDSRRYGQGFMTEATKAVTAMLLDELKFDRIELRIDDLNWKNRNVAVRCEFELDGILRRDFRYTDGRLRDTCVYSKIAGEPRRDEGTK